MSVSPSSSSSPGPSSSEIFLSKPVLAAQKEQTVKKFKKTSKSSPSLPGVKQVKPVLQTSSKTTKALRAGAKLSNSCGYALIGDQGKHLLKQTKLLKPMRAPYRAQKLVRHVRALGTATAPARKAKVGAALARDVKSLVVSSAISCEFVEQMGWAGAAADWVPYVDPVLPFFKAVTIGITANKLAKAYTVSSTTASIHNAIEEASTSEEAEKQVSERLDELEKLGLSTIRKKLGFSKSADLKGRICLLQAELKNPLEKDAAIKASKELLQKVESRAKTAFYLSMLRTGSKVAKLTGSLLVMSGVCPVGGKILVAAGVLVNFMTWGGRKAFWEGDTLPEMNA